MYNDKDILNLPESPLNRLLGLHECEISKLLQEIEIYTPANPPRSTPTVNTSKGYVYLLSYNPPDGSFYINYFAPPLEKALTSKLAGDSKEIKSKVINFFSKEPNAGLIAEAARRALNLFNKGNFLPMYPLTRKEDREGFENVLQKIMMKEFHGIEPEDIYRILPLPYETATKDIYLHGTDKKPAPKEFDMTGDKAQEVLKEKNAYTQLHIAAELLHYFPWTFRDSATHGSGFYGAFDSFSSGMKYLRLLPGYKFTKYTLPITHFNSMLGLLVVGWYTPKKLDKEKQKKLLDSLEIIAVKIGGSLQLIRVQMASSKLKTASDQNKETAMTESIRLLTGCTQVLLGSGATRKSFGLEEPVSVHEEPSAECGDAQCRTSLTLVTDDMAFECHPRHIKADEEARKAYGEYIGLLINIAAERNDNVKITTGSDHTVLLKEFLNSYKEMELFTGISEFFAYFFALVCLKYLMRHPSNVGTTLVLPVDGSGSYKHGESRSNVVQRALHDICGDGKTLKLPRASSHDDQDKSIKFSNEPIVKKQKDWRKLLVGEITKPDIINNIFKRHRLNISYSRKIPRSARGQIKFTVGNQENTIGTEIEVNLDELFPPAVSPPVKQTGQM